jgi:hypothetical protein
LQLVYWVHLLNYRYKLPPYRGKKRWLRQRNSCVGGASTRKHTFLPIFFSAIKSLHPWTLIRLASALKKIRITNNTVKKLKHTTTYLSASDWCSYRSRSARQAASTGPMYKPYRCDPCLPERAENGTITVIHWGVWGMMRYR